MISIPVEITIARQIIYYDEISTWKQLQYDSAFIGTDDKSTDNSSSNIIVDTIKHNLLK